MNSHDTRLTQVCYVCCVLYLLCGFWFTFYSNKTNKCILIKKPNPILPSEPPLLKVTFFVLIQIGILGPIQFKSGLATVRSFGLTYFRQTDIDKEVYIWIYQCSQNNARRFSNHWNNYKLLLYISKKFHPPTYCVG